MITVKRGPPYDKWGIVNIARSQVSPPLILARTVEFDYRSYPGYSHRRTRGYGESEAKKNNDDNNDDDDDVIDSKKNNKSKESQKDDSNVDSIESKQEKNDGNDLLRGAGCCTYVFKVRDDEVNKNSFS